MRRTVLPPSLVAAIALALVAPALAYHVSSTGDGRALEATSAVDTGPEVDVDGALGAPTDVTVSQVYAVAGPDGALTAARDQVLRLNVLGSVPPRVEVGFLLPGEDVFADASPVEGVPSVTTGAGGARTIVVGDELRARVDPNGRVNVLFTPNGGPGPVVDHFPAGGVMSDADGNAWRFIVRDAVTRTAPGAIAATPLAGLAGEDGGAVLTLLGRTITLGGVDLTGNPLNPDCMTAADASGAGLAVACVALPETSGDALVVGMEGPAVAGVLPGADSVSVHVHPSRVPLGVVAVQAAGITPTDDRVILADGTTGGTILALANDAGGASLLDGVTGERVRISDVPLEYDVRDPSGTFLVRALHPLTGAEVATVLVGEGSPAPITFTHADGTDRTLVLDPASGLVTSLTGGAVDPSGLALGVAGEKAFLTVQPVTGGGLRVSWPGAPGGAPVDVPAGGIELQADPTGVDGWGFRVHRAGVDAVRVDVARHPELAGSPVLMRPVVTVTAPALGSPVTIAPPVAVHGDLAAKRVDRVIVWSPEEPARELVTLEVTGAGVRVTTPVESAESSSSGIALPANALTGDVVTFQAGDVSLTIDRATGVATVRSPTGSTIVDGPVAYAGDPTDPHTLVVAHPRESGKELLRYEWGRLVVLDEERASNTRFATFDGDARSADGFAIVVSDAQGNTVERHHVSARAVAADAGLPAGETGTLLSSWESGSGDARFVTAVADARGNLLDRAALEGGLGVLATAAPHVLRLEVPGGHDAFSGIVLRAWRNSESAESVTPFVRRDDGAGDARVYEATFTPAASDGDVVRFAVQYDTRVTPFAARTLMEDGFAYRLDGSGPLVTVTAPADSPRARFEVAWGAAGGENPTAVTVERRVDGGAWETWLAATGAPAAHFVGEPGGSYSFRARGLDAVGNPGPWSREVLVRVSPDATAASDAGAPAGALTAPAAGDALAGVVTVRWTMPEGAVANVYASRDGGRTWKALYSGTASEFAWDTRGERDGLWDVRLVVTNGASEAEDRVGPLTLDNRATGFGGVASTDPATGLPGGPDGNAESATDTTTDSGEGGSTLLASLALAGAGLVGAAILAVGAVAFTRRRRGPEE